MESNQNRMSCNIGGSNGSYDVINSGTASVRTGNNNRRHSRMSCLKCCGDIFNFILRVHVTPEELEQRYKSREIDKFLAKEKHFISRQVKLLLLGAGESGKSTFLKQMRIIHGINFEPELLKEYHQIIFQNIIRGMQVLVDAREKLEIPWEQIKNEKISEQVKLFYSGPALTPEQFIEYVPTVQTLWKDKSIKRAFERRREFQISDSVSYFFDDLARISRIDYVPTHKDILRCRKATKGIYEFVIKIENIPFVFVDVGGQRTQRQKWTRCFDSSVTSILFLVSSSEFDQVLAEDRKTNRLEESKNIFDTIVNNNTFQGISIILFLNKSDLLKEKVENRETDIRWYYPNFTGDPHLVEDVRNFILEMFLNVRRNSKTTIYHHFTNAVDTNNIQVVFNSVKDTILKKNLAALMLS